MRGSPAERVWVGFSAWTERAKSEDHALTLPADSAILREKNKQMQSATLSSKFIFDTERLKSRIWYRAV